MTTRHLGQPDTTYRFDQPDRSILDVFDYERSVPPLVTLDCQEFTSLCPVTGQPDYGRISIAFVPRKLCVETKSLKLYLVAFRDSSSFIEALVDRISDDLQGVLDPWALRVFGDFHVRGGIAIRPLAMRYASDLPEARMEHCRQLMAQFPISLN